MRSSLQGVVGVIAVCALAGVMGAFLWSRASERVACAKDKTAETVRALYFAREFDRASDVGARSLAHCSDHVQLNAWYLLSTARTKERDVAAARARELVETFPQSAWSYFASAATAPQRRGDERDIALDAIAEARSRDSSNVDFLWLHVEMLRSRGRTRDAYVVLDNNRPMVERASHLLVAEGSMLLNDEAKQGKWDIGSSRALATFARARRLDPANVDAHYLPGRFLFQSGRLAEAHQLLKTAASLSYSTEVTRAYWACLVKRDDLARLEKHREIEASIDRRGRTRTHDPYLLLTASVLYGELGLYSEQVALQERLIREDGNGAVAEAAIASRFLTAARARETGQRSDRPTLASYREQLRSFLKRPRHHDVKLLRHARRLLFESIKNDPDVAASEILELANAMAGDRAIEPVIPYSHGAIALADRKSYLHEAERLAREGLAIASSLHRSKPLEASMRHALGWVYFNDGRVEQAQRELQLAHELSKQDPWILAHIATVYQSIGAHELAETALVKCVAISLRGPHPCADSLRAYYQRRHRSLRGFEAYMSDMDGRVRAARAATLIARKSVGSQPLPPFRLNVLGGGTLSSSELKGKVIAISFFALWCSVCRTELPEFAKLANRYENARDVLILAINSDRNSMSVSDWMASNNYRCNVLIDDGYATSAGVRAIPTAWFIDSEGERAYVIEGSVGNVVEEYSARIEMLRSDNRHARSH